jgi:hypothetical protein
MTRYTFAFSRVCFPILLVILQTFSLYAQTETATDYRTPRRLLVAKFAPLSLIDTDRTVQAALEYSLNRRWSVQQEFGYGNFRSTTLGVFLFVPVFTKDLYRSEVFRSRSEIRLYLESFYGTLEGGYLAFESVYKRVNTQEERTIGRGCANGPCDYFERVAFERFKDVFAFHLKLGRQMMLGKRFTADIYVGPGLRFLSVRTPGLTVDDYPANDGWYAEIRVLPGHYTLPSASAGFKVGYAIYKPEKKPNP